MSVRPTCGECGYTRTYRTQGQADYGLARHSCAKELERQAIARRKRTRAAHRRDGIVRSCEHPIAQHQHGTRQAYLLDRCRCLPCRDAACAYERHRLRQRAYGRWDHRVDAEPVRAHLRYLMANGVSFKQAARLASVSLTTTSQVLYGRHDRRGGEPPRTCAANFAAKILAVRPDPWQLTDRSRVDATGTRRRVQALVAIGWSQQVIANRVGVDRSNFDMRSRPMVTARLARAIRDLYDELWNVTPPQETQHQRISVARARGHAQRYAWLPPLAWDDDTIDDPTAQPDVVTVAAGRQGGAKLPPADELAWLLEQGETTSTIALRYRVSPAAVVTALRRAAVA